MAADPTFPRVTPHDLRHAYASLTVSSGANVKVVQRQLGHKSAAMTLDTYSDLFTPDLDAVANAFDAKCARTSRKCPLTWCPQSDSNRHLADFKSAASANWAMGASNVVSTVPGPFRAHVMQVRHKAPAPDADRQNF